MALFTDGDLTALEDLAGHDAAILDIANSEGIDLTKKLELAYDEIAIELVAILRRLGSGSVVGAGGSDLTNLVVTPPLRLWHTFHTLELAYRDAYFNQLNDRYRSRRDEYRGLAIWAEEKLLVSGIGLTGDPVPRAATPAVRATLGAMEPGAYYVAVCWVGATGQEGAPSPTVEFDLTVTGAIAVKAVEAPSTAVGWNVYAGTAATGLRLQNSVPLSIGAEWTPSPVLTTTGRLPGNGPEPTSYRTVPRVIQRG